MKNVILCYIVHHKDSMGDERFDTYEEQWNVFSADRYENPLEAAKEQVINMKNLFCNGDSLYSWNICTVEMSSSSHPEL